MEEEKVENAPKMTQIISHKLSMKFLFIVCGGISAEQNCKNATAIIFGDGFHG
jgi:hypothetical protein